MNIDVFIGLIKYLLLKCAFDEDGLAYKNHNTAFNIVSVKARVASSLISIENCIKT